MTQHRTHVKLKLKGQGKPCPLKVSLFFKSGQLERVALQNSKEFGLQFSEKREEEPAIREWFNHYFQGVITPFPIPLISNLGDFTCQALDELQKIPFGKTAAYSEIAGKLGNPQGARAVGNACKNNPFPLIIPCHRVIKSDGTLGGFAFGLDMKQMLLEYESSFD